MCKVKASLSKQTSVWCSSDIFSSAFADFSLCIALRLQQFACHKTCFKLLFKVIFMSQDGLFPICPLFSEGRARTKLKYLTISGFGGWFNAEVGTAFLWWMMEWMPNWVNFNVVSCGRECVDNCTKCVNHIVSVLFCLGPRRSTRTNRTSRKPRRHSKL